MFKGKKLQKGKVTDFINAWLHPFPDQNVFGVGVGIGKHVNLALCVAKDCYSASLPLFLIGWIRTAYY